METEKFFKTKGGRLTVAFAAILAAFALILTGLKMQETGYACWDLFCWWRLCCTRRLRYMY